MSDETTKNENLRLIREKLVEITRSQTAILLAFQATTEGVLQPLTFEVRNCEWCPFSDRVSPICNHPYGPENPKFAQEPDDRCPMKRRPITVQLKPRS